MAWGGGGLMGSGGTGTGRGIGQTSSANPGSGLPFAGIVR